MKLAYEAANAIEAQMLVDLLSREGIAAEVHGAELQGALGEIPATSYVRLLVSEEDHAKAREILLAWESLEPPSPAPHQPLSRGKGIALLLAGIVIGFAAHLAYVSVPASTYRNLSESNNPVERITLAPNKMPVKVERDRNGDQRYDYVEKLNSWGEATVVESDDDFDGNLETTTYYRGIFPVRSEIDSDRDGHIDLRFLYVHGNLDRAEFLLPGSGKLVRVEHHTLGKLTHALLDTDQDGTMDTQVTYSALGDEASRTPLQTTAPPAQ